MTRLSKLAMAALALPILVFASPVEATVKSSIEGGNIYRVKNLTKNVDFTDPASADACNELLYKVRIHNVGPTEPITNVVVKARFPTAASTQNISTITITGDNIHPSSTTDTATVNISSAQTISYESGSTQLLGANGEFLRNLPDGITGNGVNIGTVGVSVGEKRFVQLKAKVSCPVAPAPTPTPAPVVAPAEIHKAGSGSALALFGGASAAAAGAHYLVSVRRSRK